MSTTTDRIALRPTEQDRRFLSLVAAHVQRTRRTPYCTPADALRAAVMIAAETIAKVALTNQDIAQ